MVLISVLENVNICVSIISILDQSVDFFFLFQTVILKKIHLGMKSKTFSKFLMQKK